MPHKHTLLVVDDTLSNITLLCSILEPFYRVKVATNGEKALQIALGEEPPDLILLDIVMQGLDGYEVCRRIKAHPARHSIPILFVTALEQQEDEEMGLALGAEDYITKPFSAPIVLARVRTHLALYDQTRELERKVDIRTRELQKSRVEIIKRLGRAAEFRDNETGNHVLRMSHFSRLIAKAAGLGDAVAEMLFLAAPMHDIGKIGIPDYVLLKPGKLNTQEWEIMQQHVRMGAEIIGDHPDELLAMARTVAMSHHERWDGTGYPLGLKGEDIPTVGQIVAMADVFDALTSSRPYKEAWPVEQAIQTILDSAGSHFDPGLIPAFRTALPDMILVRDMYQEDPHTIRTDPARTRPVVSAD
ncbi:MAG: response regulator [Rhodoferax sp.]|nr:response regulator [Rhodoferax sp.]